MTSYASSAPLTRTASGVFGRVMSLVGIAIAFLAAGAVLGRDVALGTAQALGFVAIAMLFAQSFSPAAARRARSLVAVRARTDPRHQPRADPGDLRRRRSRRPDPGRRRDRPDDAAMGAWGLATSADLSRWLRPLSFVMLGLFVVSLAAALRGRRQSAVQPRRDRRVGRAARRRLQLRPQPRRDDDVIWLATGIFVSIVNLFLSFLNCSAATEPIRAQWRS